MLGIFVILSYAVFVYLWICMRICAFVFMYLGVQNIMFDVLGPLAFQKYSIIRVYKVFRAWWQTNNERQPGEPSASPLVDSEQSRLLQNLCLSLKTNIWQQYGAMQKKFQADWKHNGSFLLNAPWQNPWSSGPWQNPWMLRFIISMGFAMELWENPLHGKTHISWVLPWYMGFAIDLWQNPWDTLFQPGQWTRGVRWRGHDLLSRSPLQPYFFSSSPSQSQSGSSVVPPRTSPWLWMGRVYKVESWWGENFSCSTN